MRFNLEQPTSRKGRIDVKISKLQWNQERYIWDMQPIQGYVLDPFHFYYPDGGNYLDEPSHNDL